MLYTASGSQIWKSTDAGSTWTMASQFPSGVSVLGLAVSPTTSSTVYAGTSSLGISKSVDGGLTWTAMNNGIPPLPDGSIRVGSVWVEPTAPNVIFASASFGLARSTDDGNTWTLVAGGNSFSIPTFDQFTAGTLYFASGNASAGIYQSSDGGGTWSLKLAGVTTVLAADPNSSAFYANLSGYGIVKSTDGSPPRLRLVPTSHRCCSSLCPVRTCLRFRRPPRTPMP
jgi:photosystem II stability/assembly factor-like uncharacterized protein